MRSSSGIEVCLKKEIGEGSFSKVYTTSERGLVAKVMNLNHEASKNSFANERKIYSELSHHANILTYQGSVVLGNFGVLLLENCPRGSLVEVMTLSEEAKLSNA